jgi:hypothetical protein
MNLSIDPYIGVGPIKFGMDIEEVRRAIGLSFTTFKKTPEDLIPTDAFDEAGIHVFYKPTGICEAVEMSDPANPVFKGQSFIGKSFSEIREWFRSQDEDIDADDSGLTSFKYGIGIYAPNAEEQPDDPVEGVIVFERGYYD